MPVTMRYFITLVLCAAMALGLAGCGGGGNSSLMPIGGDSGPAITTQPTSAVVDAGASAGFSVVASGNNLSYQWYLNGAPIPGATSSSYSVAAASGADAGTYMVVVTNPNGEATSNAATLTVSTTADSASVKSVVAAANAFLATLTPTQMAVVNPALSLATARQWSNLSNAARNGLTLGGGPVALATDLTSAQQTAAQALAQAALSASGFAAMSEIRQADNVLRATDASQPWNSGNYHIAILGKPSASSAWMLQISGHHLAYNIVYNGTAVSATPMFLGTEPPGWTILADGSTAVTPGIINGVLEYAVSTPAAAAANTSFTTTNPGAAGGTQHTPLETQRAAVSALAVALQGDSSVAAAAKLNGTFNDVLMGVGPAGNDSNYPFTSGSVAYPGAGAGRGVLYGALNGDEQAKVKAVIEAWVNTQSGDVSASLLAAYENPIALNATYVAYGVNSATGIADFSASASQAAPLATAQNAYLRIDGPRVWIEFVVPAAAANNAVAWVQYHSLWRDKIGDYGACFASSSASTCNVPSAD